MSIEVARIVTDGQRCGNIHQPAAALYCDVVNYPALQGVGLSLARRRRCKDLALLPPLKPVGFRA